MTRIAPRGRPRKLTPATVTKIQARYRQGGVSQETIAAEFGLSVGSVSEALRMPPPESPDREPPDGDSGEPPGPSEFDDLAAVLSSPGDAGEMARSTLRGIVESLGAKIRAVPADDTAQLLQVSRVAGMLAKELARLTPPPPPRHEDNPDMIAAAAEFRRKLKEMIAQRRALLGELASWGSR